MSRLYSRVLCVGLTLALAAAAPVPPTPVATPAPNRTLATKVLPNGTTLLVGLADPQELVPFRDSARGGSLLTLELQQPKGVPVRLAARYVPDLDGEGAVAYDIQIDGSEIVVPVVLGGMSPAVWRVRPGAGDELAMLDFWQWNMLQARPNPVPADLKLAVSRLPDRRWAVELTDLKVGPKAVMHLEQDDTLWHFAPVKAHAAEAPYTVQFESLPLGGGGGDTRLTTKYFRSLADGRQLAVIADPRFPSTQLAGVAKDGDVAPNKDFRAIRIELRPAPGDGETHVLATRMITVPRQRIAYEFAVLDSLIEPGQLTFAVAEGSEIVLWRLNPATLQFDVSTLSHADWSTRRDSSVRAEAKLSRGGDGRLRVAVTDLIVVNHKEVMFTQADDAWSFRR